MKTIYINGSPGKRGFTKRILGEIAVNAGTEQVIDLQDYTILPCKGCLGCVKDNVCVQNDDWHKISGELMDAELLVIGFPTYYGAPFGVNALTHNFLERWFALRHQGLKTNLKKAVAVVTSGEGQGDFGLQSIKTFLEAYHGIQLVDSVVAEGVTTCYICGHGETCVMSCVRAKHGNEVVIGPDIIASLEKQPQVISKAREIGQKIKSGLV